MKDECDTNHPESEQHEPNRSIHGPDGIRGKPQPACAIMSHCEGSRIRNLREKCAKGMSPHDNVKLRSTGRFSEVLKLLHAHDFQSHRVAIHGRHALASPASWIADLGGHEGWSRPRWRQSGRDR